MARKTNDRPQELTKAELEIMQIIWKRGRTLVHGIIDELPDPKPAYNTVSTIVRILETKGFVSHKAYGRTHEYFPLVSKDEYTKIYMHGVLDRFFDGSLSRMVSFFSSQKSISMEETGRIMEILEKDRHTT
ncbi:MAG: BlaI/MecI/CopY family transcriptional regulator [Bacteroidetes bacterium]|uniref:BlaI/MecI/CopY family transcriptional regulator n=1 Tax=Candidatus Cryptobacteroides faecavium TaxID=2840762 RepID=A0A9D9IFA1_9BACT|nr:BlaI/MecI/CopY family transcriptional regulator [Candidatus Cryptobacteroides faecavium]